MRVLVTGAKGQLGYDVIRIFEEKKVECLGIDKEDLDITKQSDVFNFVSQYRPTHIIHCAAYTLVDKAEENKDLCYQVNVLGTQYLAEVSKELGIKMVYISTDYVFDGKGENPFTIFDKPNPVNYYGLTKYEGEEVVKRILTDYYIIRISWVFGINGNNFIKTMLKLSETKTELSVVSDQIGSPTYTYDLAYYIYDLINTNQYGIYHATNDGYCSWYDFAVAIFSKNGKNIKVNPILSKDYPTKAVRPLNSRLVKNGSKMRKWENALEHFLSEIDDFSN